MRRRRLYRTRPAILALAVVLAVVGAACTGDGDAGVATTAPALESAGEPAPAATLAPQPPASEDMSGDGDDRSLGTGGVVPIAFQADIGRDIIFTADLTVAVTDVATAGAEASRVIASLGGFLFGQQTTGAPDPVSVLTFKVRPENFQEALSRLGDIGEVRTQNVTTDDVTERVVDLESRISTAAASVERLKGFLDEANDIVTIAELENQLLERETDLETLRGQLRTIQDRVDLATITLTLTEALASPGIRVEATAYAGGDDGLSCPGDAGLTVDKGQEATVCFDLRNSGDTPLTDFELKDDVLGVEFADLTHVFGPRERLEPGQTMTLATTFTVERNTRTQTGVSATPIDQEGTPLESRSVGHNSSITLAAVDPGGLPGFTDGLSGAWNVLLWIGRLAILIAGIVVPFIWILGLIGLWIWWDRRRRARKAAPLPPPPPEPAAFAADDDWAGPAPR